MDGGLVVSAKDIEIGGEGAFNGLFMAAGQISVTGGARLTRRWAELMNPFWTEKRLQNIFMITEIRPPLCWNDYEDFVTRENWSRSGREQGRRQMMKDNTNSGFSLIELIIAMTILLVLSGMIFLGSDSARRKETEKYAAALGNEILMARTASMSKAGKWRLGLYLKEKNITVSWRARKRHPESQAGVYWESRSEKSQTGACRRG